MRASRKTDLSRLRRILYGGIAVVFWLIVWEVIARTVDLSFALPGVLETLGAFASLLLQGTFWKTVLLSLGRIALGLLIGVVVGILLAVVSVRVAAVDAILSPAMVFIRSTPVASFILVLWVIIGRAAVPVVIAVLMVIPIVYQNICTSLQSLDTHLSEMLTVFHVSPLRRFRILVLPSMLRYLIPAFVTAAGLSWKAGIAAEIIAYTKDSIGRSIANAKNEFNGPAMFAWTMAVVLLSFGIEKLLTFIGRRANRRVALYQPSDESL